MERLLLSLGTLPLFLLCCIVPNQIAQLVRGLLKNNRHRKTTRIIRLDDCKNGHDERHFSLSSLA